MSGPFRLLGERDVSSKRKYSATLTAADVWAALSHLGDEAHATLELTVRPSIITPTLVIVQVRYHDPLTVADLGPVYIYQETVSRARTVDMATLLHRIIWDSWSGYHMSPWQWTRGMRKQSTGS